MVNRKKSSILVTAIKDYINEHFCSNSISLEEVADQFRKNPAYISKVFKKETGFNFSDYIVQKRMEKSKELLKDMTLKIYEIAEMTGYADASNFIKVFKKHCGMSPNEYRSIFS
jgi:two-component response regulator